MCARTRQLQLYVLDVEQLRALLAGETRLRSLPGDASIVSVQTDPRDGRRLGILVHSAGFASVPHGMQLPIGVAVLERCGVQG